MTSLPRAILAWLLLAAGLAGALKAADRVPALIAGTPHGARVYATVQEAESAIGGQIWVPTDLPGALAWPSVRVDAWPGPPVSVAIRVAARSDGQERLVVVQSMASTAPPPEVLLPPVQALMTIDVPVGRHNATLTRALAPGGQLLHDLSWDQGTRRLTVRYVGPVEDLLRIAASLERTHS
jgi:hypothetical protein